MTDNKPRSTDSGLPRRRPGRALDAAADDSVIATKGPICGHRSEPRPGQDSPSYVCAKNPGHLGGHTMVRDDGAIATYLDPSPDPAAVSPSGGPAVDPTPPVTPGVGDALEPSGTGSPMAESSGSGGSGSGRPSTMTRPDASETVLAAAMAVWVPAGDQSFAITHAEESARVALVAQTLGRMIQALADGRLVDDDHVRVVYRKMRQIAATHGLDLHDEGAGS